MTHCSNGTGQNTNSNKTNRTMLNKLASAFTDTSIFSGIFISILFGATHTWRIFTFHLSKNLDRSTQHSSNLLVLAIFCFSSLHLAHQLVNFSLQTLLNQGQQLLLFALQTSIMQKRCENKSIASCLMFAINNCWNKNLFHERSLPLPFRVV